MFGFDLEGLSPRMRGNLKDVGKQLMSYPRACGGTTTGLSLSPRMRGNHQNEIAAYFRGGLSPRMRGNPAIPRMDSGCGSGLSPRMRGNRDTSHRTALRAGEHPRQDEHPRACGGTEVAVTVYPRACGGTAVVKLRTRVVVGLSPRMRGNPNASAGIRDMDWGLSPRMRGNPRQTGRGHPQEGSIPAHAGEPPCRTSTPISSRGGSIPAHAGEPCSPRAPRLFGGVYPRACGGTSPSRYST